MASILASEPDLPPPFITVAGIPNFRDLGGYPISYPANHSVRREVIYRCGEPSQATKDGISTINRLGITHIYDLRSNPEIQRNIDSGRGGVVEWDGCERVFVPVFAEQDYSPEKIALRFSDYMDKGPGVSR
jgi:protein tyrosine/serine phosphatase